MNDVSFLSVEASFRGDDSPTRTQRPDPQARAVPSRRAVRKMAVRIRKVACPAVFILR